MVLILYCTFPCRIHAQRASQLPQHACVILHMYILFLNLNSGAYSSNGCGVYTLRILSSTLHACTMLYITLLLQSHTVTEISSKFPMLYWKYCRYTILLIYHYIIYAVRLNNNSCILPEKLYLQMKVASIHVHKLVVDDQLNSYCLYDT